MSHFVWESPGNYARVHQTQMKSAPLGLSSARKDGTLSEESLSEFQLTPLYVLATVFNTGLMAPRSKAHKQRLNALAHVQNPGRKKAQPHPDSSSQLPVIGPRGGTSKWTVIRIQARVQQQVQEAGVARQHSPSLASHQGSHSRTPSQQPSAGPHPNAKTAILEDARSRLERKLRSKRHLPCGWQDQNWHRQVLELLNKRLLNPLQNTKILALSVVHGYHRKEKAARRLLAHEKEWISNGTIPESKQG
jgi:hypothetical protein